MRSFPPFSHTLLTKRPRLWYAHRTAAAFTEPGSEASLVPELHVEASVPTSHTALHLPGFQPIRITMDLSPSRVSLAGRSLGCLRVQGMLVHCTVDSKHHVLSANSSSVQVWQRNYWGSIQVLWRGGPSSYVVVGIIFVHIIHHAHIDIVVLIMTMMVLVLMLTWR